MPQCSLLMDVAYTSPLRSLGGAGEARRERIFVNCIVLMNCIDAEVWRDGGMGLPHLRRLPLQDPHLRQLRSPRLRRPRRHQCPHPCRQHQCPHQFPLRRPRRTLQGLAFISPIAVSTLGAVMTTCSGASIWGEPEIAQRPIASLLWPHLRHQLSNPRAISAAHAYADTATHTGADTATHAGTNSATQNVNVSVNINVNVNVEYC